MNMDETSWSDLICKIGLKDENDELDKRFKVLYATLRDITSVYITDKSLTERITAIKKQWLPARDQYVRTVLHIAAMNGNTRLVRCLVYSGGLINIQDGIGQTPLTLALHMDHTATAKVLVENGASVREAFFTNAVAPLEIAKLHSDAVMIDVIERKIQEEDKIISDIKSLCFGQWREVNQGAAMECGNSKEKNNKRALNINIGDQKNTVLVQGCANRCPDIYGCHTPGTNLILTRKSNIVRPAMTTVFIVGFCDTDIHFTYFCVNNEM
jgi:ankyrin repeat protein